MTYVCHLWSKIVRFELLGVSRLSLTSKEPGHWLVNGLDAGAEPLDDDLAVDQGQQVHVLTWMGDAANEALARLRRRRGHTAVPSGPGIEALNGPGRVDTVVDALRDIGSEAPPPLDMLLE